MDMSSPRPYPPRAINASGTWSRHFRERSGSATEDVSQQNVNQFARPRRNFATAGAGLVLQTQAMLST